MGDYSYATAGTNYESYGSTGLSYAKEACQTLAAQGVGVSRSLMENELAIKCLGQSNFVENKAYAGTVAVYNDDFASAHQALRQNGSVTIIPTNCNAFVETGKPLREIRDRTRAIGIIVEDSTAETPMTTVAVAGVCDTFNNSGQTIKQLDDVYWELPLPDMDENSSVPNTVAASHTNTVYPLTRARSRLPAGVAFPVLKVYKRGKGGIDDFDRVVTQLGAPKSADVRHFGAALDALDAACGNPPRTTRMAMVPANTFGPRTSITPI